jgi:hypothetical protein
MALRPVLSRLGHARTRWPPPARWVPGSEVVGASNTATWTVARPGAKPFSLLAVLVVAGCAEIGAAYSLARWWLDVAAVRVHHGAMDHIIASDRLTGRPVTADGLVALATVVAVASVAVMRWRSAIDNRGAWQLGVACLALCLVASPTLNLAARTSHLVAMIQLEIVAVLVPILLVHALSPMIRRRNVAEVNALRAAVLVTAVVGYPAAIVAAHLPLSHDTIIASPASVAVFLAGVGLSATAVWTIALSPILPYTNTIRLATAVWTLEIPSVVGFALVLAERPMYPHLTGWGPLGPLADQRFAGALMMAVDLVVAIPVIKSLARVLRSHGTSPTIPWLLGGIPRGD